MYWQKYFSDIILERGFNYYNMGAVEILNATKDYIDANVMGYNLYNLRIKFKDNKIESMYCNCPYEGNCKHLAAVLYYADNHPEIFNDDVNEIINKVSCDDLKEFLTYELSNDNDLFNRFKLFTNQDFNEGYYINKLKNSFSNSFNVIRFIDDDLDSLIKAEHYKLVLDLCGLIVEYLEDLHDWNAFYNILDKLDTIMLRLLNSGFEDETLEFLANIILTNDNIDILDAFTDTYSRFGDVEKLFEENCVKL
ncbi:SWIM zinc finger family protein [bacterium]|nr:SWIM zinc finger family protein [bacterium]